MPGIVTQERSDARSERGRLMAYLAAKSGPVSGTSNVVVPVPEGAQGGDTIPLAAVSSEYSVIFVQRDSNSVPEYDDAEAMATSGYPDDPDPTLTLIAFDDADGELTFAAAFPTTVWAFAVRSASISAKHHRQRNTGGEHKGAARRSCPPRRCSRAGAMAGSCCTEGTLATPLSELT